MKKIIFILSFFFLFTGCSNNKTLDLQSLGSKITQEYLTNHEIGNIDTISGRYDIDTTNVKDSLVITSKDFDDATMVLILLPENGKNKEVQQEMDEFLSSYRNQWVDMNYFPEQKDLVEKALSTTYNNYFIYIVSSDNENILKLVKSS